MVSNELVLRMIETMRRYHDFAIAQGVKNKDRYNVRVRQPLEFVEYKVGQQFLKVKRPVSVKRKAKGRGFKDRGSNDTRYAGRGGKFESLDDENEGGDVQKSVEGWIVFVTGVHEEAEEDDLYDLVTSTLTHTHKHITCSEKHGSPLPS